MKSLEDIYLENVGNPNTDTISGVVLTCDAFMTGNGHTNINVNSRVYDINIHLFREQFEIREQVTSIKGLYYILWETIEHIDPRLHKYLLEELIAECMVHKTLLKHNLTLSHLQYYARFNSYLYTSVYGIVVKPLQDNELGISLGLFFPSGIKLEFENDVKKYCKSIILPASASPFNKYQTKKK